MRTETEHRSNNRLLNNQEGKFMRKVKLRTETLEERMNRTILASNKIWNQYNNNHLRDLTKAKWDMKYWKGMGVTVAVVLILLAIFKMAKKAYQHTTEQHHYRTTPDRQEAELAPIIKRQVPLPQRGRTGHLRNNNHTHRRRTPLPSPEQHPPYRR